jgi:hypothetical protein
MTTAEILRASKRSRIAQGAILMCMMVVCATAMYQLCSRASEQGLGVSVKS